MEWDGIVLGRQIKGRFEREQRHARVRETSRLRARDTHRTSVREQNTWHKIFSIPHCVIFYFRLVCVRVYECMSFFPQVSLSSTFIINFA